MLTKVMLIDDDPRVRDMYLSNLTAAGFTVVAEPDGGKALETILKDKPEIILLDIMMPHIYGLHVLDIIKSTPEFKDIRIIMLTALADKDTRHTAQKYGADDYIVKSELTMSQVIERIKRVAEGS